MVMLMVGMLFAGVAGFLLVVACSPLSRDERPTLKFQELGISALSTPVKQEKKRFGLVGVLAMVALVLKPLIGPEMRKRLVRDLHIAQTAVTPELFILFKMLAVVVLLFLLPGFFPADMMLFAILMAVAVGYMLPEMILKTRIQKVKDDIIKNLPDTVDLLGLCVNAGLDFMMALKWVVDKSAHNVIILEMDNILQEISVGKPRREALRDLARKYELPDLSTFSRTLIQADKMGTSVSEALNILSEDMRLARYRRGEAVALKAPLKMLLPLLFCIFPVVFILVGAPIFLDFVMNNPLKNMGG